MSLPPLFSFSSTYIRFLISNSNFKFKISFLQPFFSNFTIHHSFFLNQPLTHHRRSHHFPVTHHRRSSSEGVSISRAETVGFVVIRDFKPGKFIRFSIDDGTGCIPCVLWLNQLTCSCFSKRSPSSVRVNAQLAMKFASQIQIGVVARVRGRITGYRGVVQITVSDVVLETDPNAKVLHWLDCVRLARRCYDNYAKSVVRRCGKQGKVVTISHLSNGSSTCPPPLHLLRSSGSSG